MGERKRSPCSGAALAKGANTFLQKNAPCLDVPGHGVFCVWTEFGVKKLFYAMIFDSEQEK